MSKTIDTLISDIYELIGGQKHSVIESLKDQFGSKLSEIISTRLFRGDERPALRFSNLGSACEGKLWYQLNTPGEAIPLPPEARIKFLFGDILEHLLLFLAREAGHTVEGEQDTLEVDGVKGHRDAIIDGVLVDVKSASSPAFSKFKNHGLEEDDPFGYLSQINAYLYASMDDPRLKVKDKVAFFAIDKQLGHMCLDVYDAHPPNLPAIIKYKKMIVSQAREPDRTFRAVADGKSGNEKLGTYCSYCEFREKCWPGLRTFIYSSGPRYLTKVEREPDVKEV